MGVQLRVWNQLSRTKRPLVLGFIPKYPADHSGSQPGSLGQPWPCTGLEWEWAHGMGQLSWKDKFLEASCSTHRGLDSCKLHHSCAWPLTGKHQVENLTILLQKLQENVSGVAATGLVLLVALPF